MVGGSAALRPPALANGMGHACLYLQTFYPLHIFFSVTFIFLFFISARRVATFVSRQKR